MACAASALSIILSTMQCAAVMLHMSHALCQAHSHIWLARVTNCAIRVLHGTLSCLLSACGPKTSSQSFCYLCIHESAKWLVLISHSSLQCNDTTDVILSLLHTRSVRCHKAKNCTFMPCDAEKTNHVCNYVQFEALPCLSVQIYVSDSLPVSADVAAADTCTAVADNFAEVSATSTPWMVTTVDS